MTQHWLELVNQWLEVTRPFLWLNSDSTRPSHDSTLKGSWLWLDKNDSGTSLICRKAYQKIYFVCLCQVWHFLTNMSSNLQISVHYKLLLWILLFCDCSEFKYLFLAERIYYSGEFCEVNYIWCWSSLTETNQMKPNLKQCLLLQLTASPWTTEASIRERWQFGASTNRKATSSNRAPSLSSLHCY